MAGLIFQVITLVGFCALLGDWIFRFLRSTHAKAFTSGAMLFFGFLSFSILLILVRCIFRAYELKEGYSGEAIKDEPLFIALEGV